MNQFEAPPKSIRFHWTNLLVRWFSIQFLRRLCDPIARSKYISEINGVFWIDEKVDKNRKKSSRRYAIDEDKRNEFPFMRHQCDATYE